MGFHIRAARGGRLGFRRPGAGVRRRGILRRLASGALAPCPPPASAIALLAPGRPRRHARACPLLTPPPACASRRVAGDDLRPGPGRAEGGDEQGLSAVQTPARGLAADGRRQRHRPGKAAESPSAGRRRGGAHGASTPGCGRALAPVGPRRPVGMVPGFARRGQPHDRGGEMACHTQLARRLRTGLRSRDPARSGSAGPSRPAAGGRARSCPRGRIWRPVPGANWTIWPSG